MNQKILVFAGKKQSGKTTAANFVVGYTLTQLARKGVPYLPHNFTIDTENGDLIVNAPPWGIEPTFNGEAILDLYSNHPNYIVWASDNMWPHIKTYAFADVLKMIAIQVFDIPEKWINGTNEDKNRATKIKWSDFGMMLTPQKIGQLKKTELYNKHMTVREFLQYFGTNVCRKIDPKCWTRSCFNRIEADQPEIAVITDARFKNEIFESKKIGAKIVKLERAEYYDIHDSETELDKASSANFDLIIPKDVTIKEKNQMILEAMYAWGWFDNHIDLETTNVTTATTKQ